MTNRPRSVLIISWLFIVIGSVGILNDILPMIIARFDAAHPVIGQEPPLMLAMLWTVRGLAVAGGACMLRGYNWARWLMVAWMLLHIGISFMHSALEVGMHVAIFAVIGFFLFRPDASVFFSTAA